MHYRDLGEGKMPALIPPVSPLNPGSATLSSVGIRVRHTAYNDTHVLVYTLRDCRSALRRTRRVIWSNKTGCRFRCNSLRNRYCPRLDIVFTNGLATAVLMLVPERSGTFKLNFIGGDARPLRGTRRKFSVVRDRLALLDKCHSGTSAYMRVRVCEHNKTVHLNRPSSTDRLQLFFHSTFTTENLR